MNATSVSFDNTALAFAHRSDREMKAACRLFSLMQHQWLVNLGKWTIPLMMKIGLPVKSLIRKTIFRQFVGGETLEQTAAVARRLSTRQVNLILDYGVEGKETEASFEAAMAAFCHVIDFASAHSGIPFISIKVTALGRFALLEKVTALMNLEQGDLPGRTQMALQKLSPEERAEWARTSGRLDKIAGLAKQKEIAVLVDAEESWIQEAIDTLAFTFMNRYNTGRPVLFNTFQMYRSDRMAFLREMQQAALENGFLLGAKLVRGAYMEKERRRALQKGYPSPIQKDKPATDSAFDEAVRFCLNRLDQICLMIASHNEKSNLLAIEQMVQMGLSFSHPHIHFAQLYGMSDPITFNLAAAGCNVSKYVPFGPIDDVIPYLMRRAQENTSVQGQNSRELSLIRKEIRRRAMSNKQSI